MHEQGYGPAEMDPLLPFVGQYQFRKDGIKHAWTPEAITTLQLATRLGSYAKFKEFTKMVDEKADPIFLRDFFRLPHNPLPLEEVESEDSIVKRFVGAAMSFGAMSKEVHEAIALALTVSTVKT